jgi:hypothetical protein
MVRIFLAIVLLTLGGTIQASGADAKDPLRRARTLYNQGLYDEALAAAEEARKIPSAAASADLVSGRAYLERYRGSVDAEDLARAREHLRRIEPSRFTPAERIEFLVGLGETLYFDDSSGASAVVFESILDGPTDLPTPARERILDWWANALDRDAHPRPDIERQGIYQRIRTRMAAELAANPASAVASYWAAAAARGQGDVRAAWDAAQAGWVRASLTPDHAASLRDDLEDLVRRAIIPERARLLAQSPDVLTAEWERFKEKWAR